MGKKQRNRVTGQKRITMCQLKMSLRLKKRMEKSILLLSESLKDKEKLRASAVFFVMWLVRSGG